MKKIMMMTLLVAIVLVTGSCSMTGKIESDAVLVEYTELQNYFVNNTIETKSVMRKVFKNEQQFDEFFGKAAVMGTDGEPTPVNFKTQYVLAVIMPETFYSTGVYPVSVLKNGNSLIFNYKVDKGQKMSYTIVPFVAVALDRPVTDTQLEIYFNEK